MKERWKVVHVCDDKQGNPTEWALRVADKGLYWIDLCIEGEYHVISNDGETILRSFKSLASAKQWVNRNLL